MKGQVIGQIFIYVITVVLVSVILFYGYNAITTFKDKAEKISFIQFKNDMENTIEVMSFDFGSVKVEEFMVPEKVTTVCFVTSFPEAPTLSGTKYPIIEDSVNSGVDKNVFLMDETIQESFYVGKISVDEGWSCFPVLGNKIKLRIEGKGDHAILS